MKKIITALVLSICLFGLTSLQAQTLTPAAQVSLITVSPGEELYSCFGHSALMVRDTTGIMKLYNYGTFDFNDPNFYMNFTRGKLRYMLSVDDLNGILAMAQYENRSVVQQMLNLTQAQKQRLYDFLENNALPENRFYRYDFFYDNCSSRLRDALVYACGDALRFNLKPATEPKTFRALIDPYLENKRWQDLGMDLGLGIPADKIATPYQYMFLPDYLKDDFGTATITIDGRKENLVISERTLLPNQPDEAKTPFFLKPWFAFLLLFMIVFAITYQQYKKQKEGLWVDAILFLFTALFGLVLIFLWFFTDHGVTVNNMNLLWAMPLHFVFIFLLWKKKRQKLVSSYFLAYFFVLFFLLIFWRFTPQELNASIIPFLLALALRSMYIYYRIDKDYIRFNGKLRPKNTL
ncbi:MAG TPA: DUF4105 domain-containing protein [Cytophagaceae bacterium]|nr:DUF4105 domain-containing protein [Cytophagaceae bacterium]